MTHKMAPWVSKVFIHILPRILCIERPKKDNPPNDDDAGPVEVLTDVYHCPPDLDKFTRDYGGSKRYSAQYGIPGERNSPIVTGDSEMETLEFVVSPNSNAAIEI